MALDTRLATLTHDQLVVLVKRLVARHPDLEDLVNLPLPGEVRRADAASVRAPVTRILMTMGDDWQASSRAQYELFPIVAMADDYREQGLLSDARVVYRSTIDGILALYEQLRDEESEIANVVEDCVEGLGACLDLTPDGGLRKQILRDVFEVYRWDSLDHGGYGMDAPAEKVLLARTTVEEKAMVAAWIQAALNSGGPRHSYGGRRAGGLVVQLVGDQQDADDREATYRRAGMDRELVELLLVQGRHAAALDVLRACGGDLIRIADRLVAEGLGEEATAIVNRHPSVLAHQSHDAREWLAVRGVPDAPQLEALAWKLYSFERSGKVGRWDAVRVEALRLGRLDQVLPRAVKAVDTERSGFQAARARVLGLAGRLDEAEAVLAQLPEGSWKRAALVVAAAAEGIRPKLAMEIYRRVTEDLRARRTKPARVELAAINTRLAAMDRTESEE